ncbi:MAG: 2Fe-2S iron-sulfur cluster binding domain-containing protein, partial [Thermoflexales bacterium]|nr:2Fe-2S iron-sulfur cluster binding domain-containing protein [Thermoflexales bacterium]
MAKIFFNPGNISVEVTPGALISEAAHQAGIDITQPCGGQGRCGRCAVIVERGPVRRRSTLRLSAADVQAGWALACQTVIEGDAVITVPPQEKIERRLTSDKSAAKVELPFDYDYERAQNVRAFYARVDPPSYADNTDDLARLARALKTQHGIEGLTAKLGALQTLSESLRAGEWDVTALIELDTWQQPGGPPRLIAVRPGYVDAVWGVAIDIGTTSNVVYLVNLVSGEVVDTAADYNGQVKRGEDVISR